MNRGRRRFEPPPAPQGSPRELDASKPKAKRLSRSFRQTQTAADVASPKSHASDFKTPTRIARSRVTAGFSAESPHNDTDFQQDIIWDATSPSPSRLGKRGKKHPVGAVDISEIVRRIAPKYGRPEVAEPTLQQWIGDSATIPCTPDVQVPKPKTKSPRPNGVDDLLKLAKQFDFNMFHQDEEEVDDMHQLSQEFLSDEVLNCDSQIDAAASLPGSCREAVSAAAGTDVRERLDQQMDDDLDFLFDGPTQSVSGNLSQASLAQPSQVKLGPTQPSGKPSSHGPTSGESTTNTKGPSANNEFEDNWDNDDLLNDSLVLDMTQNPHSFSVPKLCSTQKTASDVNYQTPVNVPFSGVNLNKSSDPKVENENMRQRATFILESNPSFSVKGISDTWRNTKVNSSSKPAETNTQSRCLSSRGCSVEVGPQHTWQTHQSNPVKSDPEKSQFYQRTSVASSVSASSASTTFSTKTPQTFPKATEDVSSHDEAPAVCNFLDQDLDSFFSSDLGWDDPADDNLLCEMCEDVENQIQSVGYVCTKQTLPEVQVWKQRAALQPSNRTWDNRNHQPASGRGGARPASSSLAGGSASNVAAGKQAQDCFTYTQTIIATGSTSSFCLQGNGRVPSAPAAPRPAAKGHFTFKRPNNPVSTVSNKVMGKCSAAEIELKKQQAMERRRQRLQAVHSLRALT